jgi:hypothetical protein
MRKIAFLVVALFIASFVVAQDQPAPQDQQQPQSSSKDKKKDKKKKEADDALNAEQFSDRVMENVLRDLKDGLEGHIERLTMSVFDDNEMDGYLQFQDQLDRFFEKYDAFRIHYRIVQNSVEGPKGIALVEMQMEAEPRQGRGAPMRRDEQIRLELERGKKGWKIVDFRPRDFFMP